MKRIAVVGGGFTRFWMEGQRLNASSMDSVNKTWEKDSIKFIFIDNEMTFRGIKFDNLILYKYIDFRENEWAQQIKALIEFTHSDWIINAN